MDDPPPRARPLEYDNAATLERVYELIGADQYEPLAELLTDDVELEILGPLVVPFSGKWRGVSAVLQAIRRNLTHVRPRRPELVDQKVQGNSIVVVAREQGEAVETGGAYDIHWVQIFTFRDGKLCRIHEVADGLELAFAFTG